MRILGLLIILLCWPGLVCRAGAAQPRSSSSQSAVSSFNSELISPSAIARQDLSQVPADRHYSQSDAARDGDVTCFTMHTFLVKRESSDSDVTEPAGEATCLSGPRYSVRKVEEWGKAPSR
jgi:hypothetical protein